MNNFVGMDSCVLCAAQYIVPEHHNLDKSLLLSALRKVVLLHAALGVRVIGKSSGVPSFIRLKTINLAEVVEFSDSGDLKGTNFIDRSILQQLFRCGALLY